MRGILDWLRSLIVRSDDSSEGRRSDFSDSEDRKQAESCRVVVLERLAQGDSASAEKLLLQALDCFPESAPLLELAGKLRLGADDLEASLDYFTLAAHYSPDSWNAVDGQSIALERMGRQDRSVSVIESYLARHPMSCAAVLRLASIFRNCRNFDAAVGLLKGHLEKCPFDIHARNLLGLLLAREFSQLEAGANHLREVLRISPEFEAAKSNLAWVLAEAGRLAPALRLMDDILLQHPEDHETRLMRSLALLKCGKFDSGWREYEARHASPTSGRRNLPLPLLGPGADMGEYSYVVVTAEQGLGDQIMFSSCIENLVDEGVRGILECDGRLTNLFRRSFPDFEVVAATTDGSIIELASIRGVQARVPMGSLPMRYRNSLDEFPRHRGYLKPDAEKRKSWRERLAALGPGPYVGISWRGGSAQTRTQLRSIPLSLFSDFLGAGGQFVSLQYGDVSADLEQFSLELGVVAHHFPEAIADYDETAALVSELDLVVSVCTAVAHLGGALGRPVWVLVPAVAEWRYMIRGKRMPWYPSVNMCRQGPGESWADVMSRIGLDYGKFLLNFKEVSLGL